MAELNARIIAKASATAAEEPLAADLEVAELAVNTADGKLFTKHTDGSVVTISGGGGAAPVDSVNGETGVVSLGVEDLSDVSPDTPELGSYTAKAAMSTVPSTGEWTIPSDASNLTLPNIAANGYDIATLFGYTSPGTIGISTDNVKFTYYTVLNWQYFAGPGYHYVDVGIDNQDLYDNNTAIYINFGPRPDLVDGVVAVYDAASQTYKNKKNSIVDQADFDYKREDAAYEYTFDTTDSPNPATGDAQRWTGYGDDSLFFSTTDKDSLDAEADLYSLVAGNDVAIFVNGVEVYDGSLALVLNANGNRITLEFTGGNQTWITNLTAGDIVGIRSPIFSRRPAPFPIEDGQVLTWVDANSQWEPANYISKATLQAEVAASSDFADFQSRIAAL